MACCPLALHLGIPIPKRGWDGWGCALGGTQQGQLFRARLWDWVQIPAAAKLAPRETNYPLSASSIAAQCADKQIQKLGQGMNVTQGNPDPAVTFEL